MSKATEKRQLRLKRVEAAIRKARRTQMREEFYLLLAEVRRVSSERDALRLERDKLRKEADRQREAAERAQMDAFRAKEYISKMKGTLMYRCDKHRAVPQINGKESLGGECGACIAEGKAKK